MDIETVTSGLLAGVVVLIEWSIDSQRREDCLLLILLYHHGIILISYHSSFLIWNDPTSAILIQSLTAAVIVLTTEMASCRRILFNLDLKRWCLGAIFIHSPASLSTATTTAYAILLPQHHALSFIFAILMNVAGRLEMVVFIVHHSCLLLHKKYSNTLTVKWKSIKEL